MTSLYNQDLSYLQNMCEANLVLEASQSLIKTPHPLLKAMEGPPNFSAMKEMARQLVGFKTVVVFGTGGSSLGAKSLVDLKKSVFQNSAGSLTPVIHFVDNVDPHTLDRLFETITPHETAFLVVSKSGATAETMAQFLAALSFMKSQVASDSLNKHFYVITEPKESSMQHLSQKYGLQSLDHPMDIGGRFSVFSCVGLVPALIAGISIEEVISGAQEVWRSFKKAPDGAASTLGASAMVASENKGYTSTVIMPYCDRLSTFAAWHRQLWAESLGKEGKGTLPAPAIGTVDQHSQLQLFLEGPKDKVFTLISVGYDGASQPFDKDDLACDSHLSYLGGKTISDLMLAEFKATGQTLINHGCPVRFMHIPSLSERALGGFLMHFILETMLAAKLLQVNAFDQPAVEESKRLTRAYLKEDSGSLTQGFAS